MKNSIKFLLALFLVSTVFLGCDKDKDDDTDDDSTVVVTPTNYFSYDGTNYELNNALLTEYGAVATGVYNIDVNILTPGIVIHENNNIIDSITGNGNFMYFELLTSEMSTLDEGSYTYSDGTTTSVKTYTSANATFGYKAADGSYDSEQEIISGTFTVISNSSTLEVTFDCINDAGKAIKGKYKGGFVLDGSKKKGEKTKLI